MMHLQHQRIRHTFFSNTLRLCREEGDTTMRTKTRREISQNDQQMITGVRESNRRRGRTQWDIMDKSSKHNALHQGILLHHFDKKLNLERISVQKQLRHKKRFSSESCVILHPESSWTFVCSSEKCLWIPFVSFDSNYVLAFPLFLIKRGGYKNILSIQQENESSIENEREKRSRKRCFRRHTRHILQFLLNNQGWMERPKTPYLGLYFHFFFRITHIICVCWKKYSFKREREDEESPRLNYRNSRSRTWGWGWRPTFTVVFILPWNCDHDDDVSPLHPWPFFVHDHQTCLLLLWCSLCCVSDIQSLLLLLNCFFNGSLESRWSCPFTTSVMTTSFFSSPLSLSFPDLIRWRNRRVHSFILPVVYLQTPIHYISRSSFFLRTFTLFIHESKVVFSYLSNICLFCAGIICVSCVFKKTFDMTLLCL